MDKKKVIFLGFVALVVIAIGIIIYVIARKKSIAAKTQIISDAINSGTGALGTDVDSLLVNVVAANYSLSDADLQHLKDADGGWTGLDHPEYINQVLSGKTKAQIKAIFAQFQAKYGIKFNDHLNKIFSDTFGYDTKGYQNIMSIVKAAR